jgi:hypothetical protein
MDRIDRIDSSDPLEVVIRLIRSLQVSFERGPEDAFSDIKDFGLTPQFCLHYPKYNHPHLTSIDPWEVAFFDVSMLKVWLQHCVEVHGSQCVGTVTDRTCECLTLFSRKVQI